MIPKISVFTPSHAPTFLDTCLKTLLRQGFRDWEWIVVLNHGAQWEPALPDERIRIFHSELEGVGALKGFACDQAQSEILLELDHDDELASSALNRVWKAFDVFAHVGFVYSDCAQINIDGTMNEDRFDERNGWDYKRVTVDGRKLLRVRALDATPHNVSYIWYAPNHLRAFRRQAYLRAGGYDADRLILDDQDLMMRLFRTTDFYRIPSTLYLQRIHGDNAQKDPERNAAIQNETVNLYDNFIEANALYWSDNGGLDSIDLGGAHNSPPGYSIVIDQGEPAGPGDAVQFRRGDVFEELAKMGDSSAGVIRAVDFLEHIEDKVRLFNELHRVLAPDGLLFTATPSTDGRGAFQDPTHVSFYNQNSFWYYTEAAYAKYVPEITCRFQLSRCVTKFPSQWHADHDIPYVHASLIALKKHGSRNGGFVQW